MKINKKILSIPPYISTAWKNVASLHVETQNNLLVLVVILLNGNRIDIPGVNPGIIKAIFAAHASSIECETTISQASPTMQPREGVFSFALQADSGLENIGPLLQHNPDLADSPSLPEELLQKITSLSKMLGVKDPNLIPQPEPHCNCMHCQIAKALHAGLSEQYQEEEEIVTDEDLQFRTWDIRKTGDKLYSVSNPCDAQECYNVYLGEPVGCTCGTPHCEHIRIVLNS